MTTDPEMMNLLKAHIETELHKSIINVINTKQITHNHPPLRRIVDGCDYCKKFGNIFVIGN